MSPLELVCRLEREAAQAVAAFDAVRSAPGNVLASSALSLGEAWRSRCIALYRLSWARLALSEVPREIPPARAFHTLATDCRFPDGGAPLGDSAPSAPNEAQPTLLLLEL